MPYLVRAKGHVFVEFLRGPMTPAIRRNVERLVYPICIVMCAYLAWVASSGGILAWREGSYETRNFSMPDWLVYMPMALGFWLATLEWLRYLVGHDSMHHIDALYREGF